ncbi:MAG TPA: TfoX/Sxy family protein [Stellaceae bacterium]|nr:TfoX/Sxy family protein [Stellaceae bacterium]
MAVRRAGVTVEPSEHVKHILDLLSGWAPVDARRMFSGYGIFRGGLMFGLVIRDALHFKTDNNNRGEYETAGMAPFHYERGKRHVALGYHAVPAEVLEDCDLLAEWAEKAYAAALSKAASHPKRAAKARNEGTARGRRHRR